VSETVLALRLPLAARLRDVLELTKPRITSFVVLTAAMGAWLAPRPPGAGKTGVFLAATALLVASANILNCWLERESDGRMVRTRNRPLPAGRLDPWGALALGLGMGAFAVPMLALATNPKTALLGAVAHATYVLLYTPLKRVTPHALLVGAVPGALPPLMGWTAATGEASAAGWVLFGLLFFWQLPHFVAITLYLEEDYRRGGLQVLPVARGAESARRHLLAYTSLLFLAGFGPAAAGLAGTAYVVTAAGLGGIFLVLAAAGVRARAGGAWARRTFLYSLVHLLVLLSVLLLDAR
jgi:heme o synthase